MTHLFELIVCGKSSATLGCADHDKSSDKERNTNMKIKCFQGFWRETGESSLFPLWKFVILTLGKG